jgi:hypothetical protein
LVKRTRTFLEAPGTGTDSYVAVEISENYAELKIADCTTTVTLWFDRIKGRKRMQNKVDRLQKALDQIRAALEE